MAPPESTLTTASSPPKDTYIIVRVPPPTSALIAPHGFPAPPLPPGAPPPFLDAMRVRLAVFCDEQQCSSANELDEDDGCSWQWVVYARHAEGKSSSSDHSAGEPIACIRLCPPPHLPHPNGFVDLAEEAYVKLQRFATLAAHRGKGVGRRLVDEALRWAVEHGEALSRGLENREEWKGMVLVHAQTDIQPVWAKMGFGRDERLGEWDEEGIMHVGMWKRLDMRGKDKS